MTLVKSICVTATLLAAAVSSRANAAIITVGDLVTDSDGRIIENTKTGQQYSRLDETYQWTYQQLLAQLSDVNSFWYGWTIANSHDSDAFIEALFASPDPATPCFGAASQGTQCGRLADWNDGDFGLSHDRFSDYYFYESTEDTPDALQQPVGFALIVNGEVRDNDDWGTTSYTDQWSTGLSSDGFNIGYLLSRSAPAQPVPAPNVLSLFALGLVGIAVRRRRVR